MMRTVTLTNGFGDVLPGLRFANGFHFFHSKLPVFIVWDPLFVVFLLIWNVVTRGSPPEAGFAIEYGNRL